jgi:hypothetical protein
MLIRIFPFFFGGYLFSLLEFSKPFIIFLRIDFFLYLAFFSSSFCFCSLLSRFLLLPLLQIGTHYLLILPFLLSFLPPSSSSISFTTLLFVCPWFSTSFGVSWSYSNDSPSGALFTSSICFLLSFRSSLFLLFPLIYSPAFKSAARIASLVFIGFRVFMS